jgi:hypothetical protein
MPIGAEMKPPNVFDPRNKKLENKKNEILKEECQIFVEHPN